MQHRAEVEDDGFAQYFVADHMLQSLFRGELAIDDPIQVIGPYLIQAIRKQIRGHGPYNLAYLSHNSNNNIEAAAWLTIDERMGGDGFAQFGLNASANPYGRFYLTQYEINQGAIRAEELVAEHDLSDGLRRPAECSGQ